MPFSPATIDPDFEDPSDEAAEGAVIDLTIDELARRSGTTTRNIRALQSQGALAHPEIVGRTAHYSAVHLDRLEMVMRLQRSGFSISSIATLFDAFGAGRTLGDVLGVSSQPPKGPGLRLISDLPSNLIGTEI
ncbi:MAG: MerR family transcriptional regulator [Acidimicrobiales bacterium]|jgi:DNA-binding transcriptional MerR regulator